MGGSNFCGLTSPTPLWAMTHPCG